MGSHKHLKPACRVSITPSYFQVESSQYVIIFYMSKILKKLYFAVYYIMSAEISQESSTL